MKEQLILHLKKITNICQGDARVRALEEHFADELTGAAVLVTTFLCKTASTRNRVLVSSANLCPEVNCFASVLPREVIVFISDLVQYSLDKYFCANRNFLNAQDVDATVI